MLLAYRCEFVSKIEPVERGIVHQPAQSKRRIMVVVIGTRLLCGGCLLGSFMGLLVGCVLGGPTALFTYLLIQDAVRHGATKSFSLDNCTSANDSCIDVPPSVLSAEIADDWAPASHYIWSLFHTCLSVGAAVGLGACNAQSCLLHLCNSEGGERRVVRSTPSRPNTLALSSPLQGLDSLRR